MKKILAIILSAALILSLCPVVFAADTEAEEAAWKLHGYGLFKGTGTDADGNPVFSLDRAPNRNEAVTMLVRLLGKEDEANEGEWETPFTDMDEWAVPYIGYAYANKLTNGTGSTTYSGKKSVTAAQYITFVLRALGYSSDTDFRWNEPWLLSDTIGLTDGRYNEDTAVFTRGDAAIVSAAALDVKLKDQEITLLDSLIESGAVSIEDNAEIDELVNEAYDAYEIGDYAEAYRLFSQAAEAGDAESMYWIGFFTYYGYAVEPNEEEAFRWFLLAAENGDVISMKYVGECYYNGSGTEQDYEKSFEWSKKAADLGNTRAIYILGCLYYNGYGVEQDYEKAAEYFWMSADQGNTDAQVNLGYMYYYGLGVEQSYELAFDQWVKAADSGDKVALYNVGWVYECGYGVPQNYQYAAEYYQKAVDKGHITAYMTLGLLYLNGNGVSRNPSKAVELLRTAADAGNQYAQYHLGTCYEYGTGVAKDIDEAMRLYKLAADQGNELAASKLQ